MQKVKQTLTPNKMRFVYEAAIKKDHKQPEIAQ